MTVRISSELHDQLLSAAAASPDAEICGLLIGQDHVEQIIATRNVATNPRRRFEIEPEALFAAIRMEREGGVRLLGYYHSHPSGPASPSAHDEAQASVDGRIWLIIGAQRITAWLMTEDRGFTSIDYQTGN